MIVIPAIDLKNGRCVRLRQGRSTHETVYDQDPVAVARQFATAGAQLIHVVDLDAAFSGGMSPNRAIVAEIIADVGVAVQFGGGVRTERDIQALLDLGIARVVLGTLATQSSRKLAELVARFRDAIVVGIDARGERVMVRAWEASTEITAMEFASQVGKLGVSRIIYTDIARDGTLSGVNIEETIRIARAAGIPVTASGGISSLEDLNRLVDIAEPLVDSVIIGKALYEKRFTLEQALETVNREPISTNYE